VSVDVLRVLSSAVLHAAAHLLCRYWAKAGVADKVDSRLGPALEGLQQLLQQEGEGCYDFAFIDADKRGYQAYFELCLKLVRPGGCIAVDNVLFYGKVADESATDKATLALRKFNADLMADERVAFSIVLIGDGMALCRKR
jgi:predicted O-methyltransferase YrrM